jgi:hypothetical protein
MMTRVEGFSASNRLSRWLARGLAARTLELESSCKTPALQ